MHAHAQTTPPDPTEIQANTRLIGHSMNNQLHVISGMATLLDMSDALGTEEREYLEQIQLASARCTELARSLLRLGRQRPELEVG
jgi:signal transduction histidine kinase